MALSTRSPHVNVTRARQGRGTRQILWVLIFGVALTVLAFTAAFLAKQGDFASANSNNGGATSGGPAAYAPEPAPIQNQPDTNPNR